MLLSILSFTGLLILICGGATGVMEYHTHLSNKRDQGTISEGEIVVQSVISLMAKPVLIAMLSDNPITKRVLVSVAVLLAGGLTLLLIRDVFILILLAILMATTWLSL